MQALSLTKAKFFIAKARAFDAEVAPVVDDSASNPTDDKAIDVLQDTSDNPIGQELADSLKSLNRDEMYELMALVWLGRGDFSKAEWAAAIGEASRFEGSRLRYLMRQPMLGDLIEEGLAELGYSLEELSDYEH